MTTLLQEFEEFLKELLISDENGSIRAGLKKLEELKKKYNVT